MERLVKLGFIDVKAGSSGPFTYVLIWNPHQVVHDLHAAKTAGFPEDLVNVLNDRLLSIGALDAPEEPQAVSGEDGITF